MKIWEQVGFYRRIIWVAAVFLLWLLTSANYFWADSNQKQVSTIQQKERSEKPQRDELLTFVGDLAKKNLKVNKTSTLQLKAKFLIFDDTPEKKNEWIGNLNNTFSENLIAKNKNELRTIVDVKQQTIQTKRYTDGSYGFVYSFTISVIDVPSETITFTKEIRGTDPPSSKSGRGSAFGTYPLEELTKFIKTLSVQ